MTMLLGMFSWAATRALLLSNQLSLNCDMPRLYMLDLTSAGLRKMKTTRIFLSLAIWRKKNSAGTWTIFRPVSPLAAVQALDDLVHLDDVLLGHGLVDQLFFQFLARLQFEVARLVVFVAAEIAGEIDAGALEQLAGQRGAAAGMADDKNAVLQDVGPDFFLCFGAAGFSTVNLLSHVEIEQVHYTIGWRLSKNGEGKGKIRLPVPFPLLRSLLSLSLLFAFRP